MKTYHYLIASTAVVSVTTGFVPHLDHRTSRTVGIAMVKNPFQKFSNPFANNTVENDDANIDDQPSTSTKKTPSNTLPFLETLGLGVVKDEEAPSPKPPPPSTIPEESVQSPTSNTSTSNDNKFDFVQRIESIKCAVFGALTGAIAVTPVTFFHYATTTSIAQWELATDMAAIQGALFAIVYRYAIRNDDNPMLNQGVLGAFVLVRTLPSIQASPECKAVPLNCGAPIGYFNWDMLNQAFVQGIESVVLFGGAYLGMEYAFEKGWISRFD